MSRLAICAIFKNEAPFLLEWLAYHCVVGFDHFYLYDNDSTDGGPALIRESPLASRVTLTHWAPRPGQLLAYSHFIEHHAGECDRVAFIDVDEFLLPLSGRSVRPVLDQLNDASSVLVRWRVFGPSGWQERPEGLVIDNYTMRVPDEMGINRHVKSIVKCADLLGVTHNPHEFRIRGRAADPTGKTVPNNALQFGEGHRGLVINHYQTRSYQDWRHKMSRGSAMIQQEGPKYDPGLIDHYAQISTVADETIRAFADDVRAVMAGRPVERAPAVPVEQPVDWIARGNLAWEHRDGTALVFCDSGRSRQPWLAGMRRSAARLTDPTFLTDPLGRILDFPNAAAARAACEAELARIAAATAS